MAEMGENSPIFCSFRFCIVDDWECFRNEGVFNKHFELKC